MFKRIIATDILTKFRHRIQTRASHADHFILVISRITSTSASASIAGITLLGFTSFVLLHQLLPRIFQHRGVEVIVYVILPIVIFTLQIKRNRFKSDQLYPALRCPQNKPFHSSVPDCAPIRSGSSAGDAAAAGSDCCSISVGNFVDPSNHGCGEIASSPVGVPRYQQGNPCCHPGVVVVGGPAVGAAEGFGSGCEIPVALGAYTWAVPSSSFAGGNWVHCSAAVVGC